MNPTKPHMIVDRTVMIISVLLLAGAATYAELRYFGPQAKPSNSSSIATSSDPKPSTQAKPAAPKVRTATTSTYVHVRAAKSTSSAIITNLEAGTPVQIREGSDATWQGVRYNGKDGYIYKTYLQY